METEQEQQLAPSNLAAIESQAKAKYAEALNQAVQAKQWAREAVMAMAECGTLLLMGREHVRGSKSEWVLGLGIPLDHADKAVSLARNRDQLELELWPADVAKLGAQFVGLLPPPGSANREQNDPERTTGASGLWLSHAGKLQKSLFELFNARPLDAWRDDERENLRVSLKPLVEIFNRL